MTDRELLEAAAREAGYVVRWVEAATSFNYEGLKIKTGEKFLGTDFDAYRSWNPLESDADALRLAVKLDLSIYPTDMPGRAAVEDGANVFAGEPHGDDKLAATRRAIVRAAAAMAGEKDEAL